MISGDAAAAFLVSEWNAMGFDVPGSAASLIAALTRYVVPPGPQNPNPKPQTDASHVRSALVLKPQPGAVMPVPQNPNPKPQTPCPLCGGTGCRACQWSDSPAVNDF